MLRSLKQGLHHTGYDPEELYFHALSQEQIEKYRFRLKRSDDSPSLETRDGASEGIQEQDTFKKAA